MRDNDHRQVYGFGLLTVNFPVEKYLFNVIANGKEYKVIAENLTQVVNKYPDADRIENAGEVKIL